jgi:hypothetical protein
MSGAYDNILARDGATRARRFAILALTMAVVLAAMWLTGLLDPARFATVGAGGIGFELIAALRVLENAQVSAILICIFVCVTIVDGLGAALRRSLK